MNDFITIETKTWDQNKENLFDYESNSFKRKLLTTNTPSIQIYPNPQSNNCIISPHLLESNEKPLISIMRENTSFFKVKSCDNDLWSIVNRSTEIRPKDIVKLGRVQLELIAFLFNEEFLNEKRSYLETKDNLPEEKVCKICYDMANSLENPLLDLCNCQGSMKYSHFTCIKEWMKNKVKIIEKNLGVFVKLDLSEFRCEICGTSLDFYQNFKGKNFFLLDFLQEFKEFVVFRIEKLLIFFNFSEKNEVSIGRGYNSGFRLDDSTVSRLHCRVFKGKNSVLLEDLGSKFGTLVKMRKSFVIDSKNAYNLQRNNTVFSIKRSERKKKVLDFCFCGCT